MKELANNILAKVEDDISGIDSTAIILLMFLFQ